MSKRGNGEGSVYRLADGRWVAAVTSPAGKRRVWYGKTRQEAASKLTAALKLIQDGLPIPTERTTAERFLSDWLQAIRPSLRPRTWTRYEQYVRVHALPEIGKLALSKVTPQSIQKLYARRLDAGASTTTVNHLHAVPHRAFGQAARWGLIARNPADLVDPPRNRHHEMATFSPDQAKGFLKAAEGDRLEALCVVALTTGMRQGELLALRWRDVDLDGARVHIRANLQRTGEGLVFAEPKTRGSRRQVRLAEVAVGALRRHRTAQLAERLRLGPAWEDNDLVFANEVGCPIEATNLLRRSFRRVLERAGLPRIRFHDLRHSAATLLLGRGIHPKIVAELLGHADVGMTLRVYSHVTPDMQGQAPRAFDALLG
jgi:integrase